MKNSLVLFIINGLNRFAIFLKYFNRSIYIGYDCRLHRVDFTSNNNVGNHNSITNVSLGKRSYISSNNRITNCNIGAFTSIGSSCLIGLANHPITEYKSTHPFIYQILEKKKLTNKFAEHEMITIGNDVWIGDRVIILGGVIIGDGAIIGAGSVVTKDILPYTINAGVPSRIIKPRPSYNFRKVSKNWWHNQDEYIIKNIDDFII